MQILPAVDVLDGRVVRLQRGDFGTAQWYADDPVEMALEWIEQGARLVHVVDLDAARSGVIGSSLCRRLGSAQVPFQIGGGIRSVRAAAQMLEGGAGRVVVGTTAVWDPGLLTRMVEGLGSDRMVAALDVRGDRAVGAGWRDTGKELTEVTELVAEAGVEWVLVTSVERDGMLGGPDVDLVGRIRRTAGLRVIGSGGVASLEDLRALAAAGASAVVVGRALYEGSFTLREGQAALAS